MVKRKPNKTPKHSCCVKYYSYTSKFSVRIIVLSDENILTIHCFYLYTQKYFFKCQQDFKLLFPATPKKTPIEIKF